MSLRMKTIEALQETCEQVGVRSLDKGLQSCKMIAIASVIRDVERILV